MAGLGMSKQRRNPRAERNQTAGMWVGGGGVRGMSVVVREPAERTA